jgi:single-strand DNA-binding protein
MEIRFDGNLGKDAVIGLVGEAEHQYSRCYFWVAENVQKRDNTTKTLWHKVTIWRGFAEKMAEYLKKGRHVWVEGTAEAKFYTDNNNAIRPYIDVQASKIRFMDEKPADQTPPEEATVTEDETPWDEV